MHIFFELLHCVITTIFGNEFCDECSENKIEVVFTEVHGNGLKIRGEIKNMELREGQQVTITADLKTKKGNAASFDEGTATFESSDESIASVTQNPDNELEATIVGLDGSDNGSAVITFRVDGDPDEDESRDIVGTLDVVVTQGEATVVELRTGAVTDEAAVNENSTPTEETPAPAEEIS